MNATSVLDVTSVLEAVEPHRSEAVDASANASTRGASVFSRVIPRKPRASQHERADLRDVSPRSADRSRFARADVRTSPDLFARSWALAPLMVLGSLVVASGCSTAGDILSVTDVRPWERDALAREDMQLVTDVMDDAVDDHLYFSKEASTGGGSVRGGGCGCN